MKDSAAQRADAARALRHVLGNRTIDWVKDKHPEWFESALVNELVYGITRHAFSLRRQVDATLQKPLRDKDLDVYALMLVGAYQLSYSRIPVHAAVNETVAATKDLRKPWSRGLVNGVLRTLSRQQGQNYPQQREDTGRTVDSLLANPGRLLADPVLSELPEWLFEMVLAQYPHDASAILAACLERAPMTLRVNERVVTRDDYRAALTAAGIAHRDGPACGLTLASPQPAATLPQWDAGAVAVQDGGGLFAAPLLLHEIATGAPASNRLRILDACAAPGGKLCHLLESLPKQRDTQIVALEYSAERIAQTHAITARLGHDIRLTKGDARNLDWWDGEPFTHILVDAPCSGSGTLRRHPDLKLLLEAKDLATHAAVQKQILSNLWQTLAHGGTLLYCTCSLLRQENDDVISALLSDTTTTDVTTAIDASVLSIHLPTGRATAYGWQLLPTDPETDGFYYARLQRHVAAGAP